MEGWEELWKKLDYLVEYGFHANDVNRDEFESEIKTEFEKFARANGLPAPVWGQEEEVEDAEM